ncbi:MAG: MFS transporter [Firmicutes bacterium]|nr:MFS transporter [Bacillota bacterium]
MNHTAPSDSKERPALPPAVITVGIVSFCTDLSTQMVGPLLPLFLTSVLGAPVWVFGLIEGVGAGIAGVLKVFSGWLSDRIGHRKGLMMLGYAISNLSKPLLALSGGWGQVFVIRGIERVGKGFRTAPRDALLADVTTPANRGRSFGFRRAMDELGAALGPLAAAAVLLLTHNHIPTVFALTVIPGLAALVALATLKETRKTRDASRPRPTLSLKHFPRRFHRFTLTAGVLALATFSQGFLVLRARSLGMNAALIPIAYFLMNGVASALSMPSGTWADRLGKRPVLLVGFGLLPLAYLGFAEARSALWIWPLMAFYGAFIALVDGNQKVYAAEFLSPQDRGTGLGTFNALIGLTELLASLGAGILWQAWGAPAAFFAGALVAAFAFVMLWASPNSPAGPATTA